jgi:hypothetical protein
MPATDTQQPLLHFMVARHYQALIQEGVPSEVAMRRADALEEEIRVRYGAGEHYVPSTDFLKRNRVLINAWDTALRENGALPQEKRLTMHALYIKVANAHGISRRTLETVVAGKVAAHHLP